MKIILYDEGASEALDIGEVAAYLARQLAGSDVECRPSPLTTASPEELAEYARRVATMRISSATEKLESPDPPLYAEVEFEKRRLLGTSKAFGVAYDGVRLQKLFAAAIPADERRLGTAGIFLSNRLFTTWDNGDRRYHFRSSVMGVPTLISTTGIVEAPAKPREYYLLKQQYEAMKKDLTEINDRFRGRFIDYDDERLTEVVKGLAMQAVSYALADDPFCEDRGCRFYNAHWQEELIFAQLTSDYEFCPRHRQWLARIDSAAGLHT